MRNGDISNEMPKRILVVDELFTSTNSATYTKWLVVKKVKKNVSYDKIFLNKLYHYSVTSGTTLELISYDLEQDELELLYNELDRVGTNPFRYYTAYKNVNSLVSELPYRPEVIGVLDINSRQLRYGHWGLDL